MFLHVHSRANIINQQIVVKDHMAFTLKQSFARILVEKIAVHQILIILPFPLQGAVPQRK